MLVETNYREILKEVLAERVKKNPAYSLRAFAAQLGIAPSMLSSVLKGSKNLSAASAFEVAQKCGFNQSSTDLFCLLVQLELAKKPSQKEKLLERIHTLQPESQTQDLSLDIFKSMSDWAHVATLVLFELKKVSRPPNPQTIAKRLGITAIEAESILKRLERLELVEKDAKGNYQRSTHGHLKAKSDIANTALREFHRSSLQKALESIETQTPLEKFIGSETLTFDPKKLPEVTAAILECFRKIKSIAEQGEGQTEVYHLGTQFFRFTNKEKSQ